MFKLLAVIVLAINVAERYVTAECKIKPIDRVISSKITCNTKDFENVLLKFKYDQCDSSVTGPVGECFRDCGSCGDSFMCIENRLDIMNMRKLNCNSYKTISKACQKMDKDFLEIFDVFIKACDKHKGDAKKTIDETLASDKKNIIGEIKHLVQFKQ